MVMVHFTGMLGVLFLYIDVHTMGNHQKESRRLLLSPSDVSRNDRIKVAKLLRWGVSYQCPEVRRPSIEYDKNESINSWRVLKVDQYTNVYLKFAYKDLRTEPPQVRMFTLLPKNISVFAKFNTLCYFWPNQSEVTSIYWAKHREIDSFKKIAFRGNVYRQHLISCDLPPTGNESHISVVMGNCSKPQFLLPLVTIPPGSGQDYRLSKSADLIPWKHEFGICVMISYGYLDDSLVPWFIEWFEFHNLLGVSHINVYNGTLHIGSGMSLLWDYYKTQGLLTVHSFNPPLEQFTSSEAKSAAKLSTRASLNDCLYRHMYLYRYVIVVDFDEIIIPHEYPDYHSLVEAAIIRYHTLPHIKFSSFGFYQTYPRTRNGSSSGGLISMEYLYSSPDRRYKAFINPRTCLSGYAHGCDHELHHKSTYIKRGIGAKVHHYRQVCESDTNPLQFSAESCEKLAQQRNPEYAALRFKSVLEERVREVRRKLQ